MSRKVQFSLIESDGIYELYISFKRDSRTEVQLKISCVYDPYTENLVFYSLFPWDRRKWEKMCIYGGEYILRKDMPDEILSMKYDTNTFFVDMKRNSKDGCEGVYYSIKCTTIDLMQMSVIIEEHIKKLKCMQIKSKM